MGTGQWAGLTAAPPPCYRHAFVDEQRKPHLLGFVARELGAYALHGALGVRRRGDVRPEAGPGPTVLFIHGHGGTGAAFHLLEKALARAGQRRFAAWEYDARGGLDDLAARLADFARTVDGDLHVVAHSLGGILARIWLQELGGRPRALSLTTLSTPHGGLAAVPGAALVPLVREIRAGSEVLARLEGSVSTLGDLPCLSLVSTRDHFVRPWQAAAFGSARLVTVDHVGHVGVLFSRRVHGVVAEFLAEVR